MSELRPPTLDDRVRPGTVINRVMVTDKVSVIVMAFPTLSAVTVYAPDMSMSVYDITSTGVHSVVNLHQSDVDATTVYRYGKADHLVQQFERKP